MTKSEHYVTVLVATDLLAELREWSQPVQAQIQETPGSGTGYEMTFRVSEPTYTAAEVKVLTETATRLGVALGRKEAAEEFDQLGATLMEFANNDRTRMRQATDLAMRAVYKNRADGYGDSAEAILRVSRSITSQPQNAASDATSGVPRHSEVSEAAHPGLHPLQSDCTDACWNKVDHP